MSTVRGALLLAVALCLLPTGCGQTGPLYLPQEKPAPEAAVPQDSADREAPQSSDEGSGE